MSTSDTLTIRLTAEARSLFDAYQAYTGASAEVYVEALVEKTLPTLKALVSAMEEAGDDGEAVMELFGRKMAESMIEQQKAASSGSV